MLPIDDIQYAIERLPHHSAVDGERFSVSILPHEVDYYGGVVRACIAEQKVIIFTKTVESWALVGWSGY